MEIYNSYIISAQQLSTRIGVLSKEICAEEDSQKLESLKMRKRLLEQECADLLSIAQALKSKGVWGEFY